MKFPKFFWSAPGWQALLEAGALGLLIVYSLARLEGLVTAFTFNNGMLFLYGACGLWVVLRARIPAPPLWRQAARELGLAMLLSLLMWPGLEIAAHFLGWDALWRLATWGTNGVRLVALFTGPGYLALRVGVRLWRGWERLRRRRMLWSLTHAHLTVVAVMAVISTLCLFLLTPYSQIAAQAQVGPSNPAVRVATAWLLSFFPVLNLAIIFTATALALVLPPSALFSFWVARRTTRRLERLAAATSALRAGHYATRVKVEGEDEVARLQADFNAMAEKLEQTLGDLQQQHDTVARLLQLRRELVASVSHELRTPVATLRAALESTLDNWPAGQPAAPPALRRDLETMSGEVLRLQDLIDDLFLLSQAEVGRLALERRPVDLAPVIQRMVAALASLAWQSGRVEVAAEAPLQLPPALVDERRVEQVLANLLRNAVRHTAPGGIVVAAAAAEPQAVRLEVRDTGEGIASADLPHIWERFYRGAGAQADGGAGLGLALVKELTEAMGGTVAVESTPGQGSVFTIRLPRA